MIVDTRPSMPTRSLMTAPPRLPRAARNPTRRLQLVPTLVITEVANLIGTRLDAAAEVRF
jgi:hypothetical protein